MKFFLTAVIPHAFMITWSGAAVIASTNFDGRVLGTTNVANDTATGSSLNWVTNGVANPGSMNALAGGVTGQALFNTTTLTQNMFAPAVNTGNGNTFWTTNISLTVSPGSTVSLENITFDYWAISGGGAQNPNRRSDFTATLFNPSAVSVGAVSITDVINGTDNFSGVGTPVTLTFSSPIALIAPGTYSLQIRGGDYAGTDETGNHTGIDNLSVNGTVVPEPTSLALSSLGLICLASLRRRAS